MHNIAQNTILAIISVLIASIILLFYMITHLSKPKRTGAIPKNTLRYLANYRRVVKAKILAYMYDGWVFCTRMRFYKNGFGPITETMLVDPLQNSTDEVVHFKQISNSIAEYMELEGLVAIRFVKHFENDLMHGHTIRYYMTFRGKLYMWYILLRYQRIVKRVKQLNYITE